ncbi:hypothetical protein Tco_1095484 [Tanacetum coccineum]
MPMPRSREAEHNTNGCRLNHQTKSLIAFNPNLLVTTISDKASLISTKGSVCKILVGSFGLIGLGSIGFGGLIEFLGYVGAEVGLNVGVDGRGIVGRNRTVWENGPIKGDVAKNDNFISGVVKAMISSMVRRIAKEDTRGVYEECRLNCGGGKNVE